MHRLFLHDTDNGIDIRASQFQPESVDSQESAMEYSAILTSSVKGRSFAEEALALENVYNGLISTLGKDVIPVFKRYFLSDPSNQAPMLLHNKECAVSVIGQSPLDGTRLSMWVYLVEGAKTTDLKNGFYSVRHGDFIHYWQGGAAIPDADSLTASRALLDDYSRIMGNYGCSLNQNCVRTWFFVRDVDINYAGLVRGRNEVFAANGLRSDTHFIASTGICGTNADRTVLVTMDTYTVKGLMTGQMRHLYAPTHLNPTYEYGVAFERGTMIDYGDRRHVYISGTASIDNRGKVMYPGDIRLQTRRMWDNVEALLNEAECGYENVMHMIVYLRDIADYTTVEEMFRDRFPDIPRVIVLAPVCRPEWLVEMECMAVSRCRSEFKPF